VPGPYEIYVIRHGVAEERGEAWPDDTKRPLTPEGISRLRKVARGLINLGVSFEVVLTSPLVRAKQTADAIAGAFDARPPIVTIDSLSPGSSYASLLLDLEKQSRRSRIALVGHEPGLGEFAARLAGSRHPFEFKKGAVCRVDIETLPPAGSGALRWFLTPKILRAIKR